MEKFCVITNAEKDQDYEMARYIRKYLVSRGKSCFLVRDRFLEADIGKYAEIEEIPEDSECIIVLGGDGTMLQAANDTSHRNIPVLGINLGTLGFLTDVEKQDVEASLEALFCDQYRVERRIMLSGSVEGRQFEGTALNDFVISKAGSRRLIELEVYADDEFIDTYVADGLIVSTPTGSTGYNLSAGGPVLAPQVQAMIITPICPHSLNKRSLVLDSSSRVLVRVGKTKENADDEAVVIADGSEVVYMKTGEGIVITRSQRSAKIIKLSGSSFFKRMRQKLNRSV